MQMQYSVYFLVCNVKIELSEDCVLAKLYSSKQKF